MNSETSGGTGECGVFIKNRETYHTEILPESMPDLAEVACRYFNVTTPSFEVRNHSRRCWGKYIIKTKTVAIYEPIRMGVVLHEVCHHIRHEESLRTGIKEQGHHDHRFKQILQEVYNLFDI